MACENPKPIYANHSLEGISGVSSQGDGYHIAIDWFKAYPSNYGNTVIYNIYYSTLMDCVFAEGVKQVSYIDGYTAAWIQELTPGDTYYFAVRAVEVDLNIYNPQFLPDSFPNLKSYPEGVLLSDMTDSQDFIEVSDISEFPSMGVVQVGYELIRYSAKDLLNNTLLIASVPNDRGFNNSNVRFHTTDGYDGYYTSSGTVKFWSGWEELNDVIHSATASFSYPNWAWTATDGYRTITDNLTTDLSGSDANQIDFPMYDYAGWHRTDLVSLMNGDCIDTYLGGERGCADGYEVGGMERGFSLNDENTQRQELLLELTGEPVVLLKKMYEGIQCKCIEPTTQSPSLRCLICFGQGFVVSYEQYHNPRRSDGRILVRFGPVDDEIKSEEDGFESVLLPDCWTLVVPALKSRDVIIRFDENGVEEFRYEILKVTRNKLLNSVSGGQKFVANRIRKTDPVYTFDAINDTSDVPRTIFTSMGMGGGVSPHTHNIIVGPDIVNISQINGVTSVSQGHSHRIVNGVLVDYSDIPGGTSLGHTHELLP